MTRRPSISTSVGRDMPPRPLALLTASSSGVMGRCVGVGQLEGQENALHFSEIFQVGRGACAWTSWVWGEGEGRMFLQGWGVIVLPMAAAAAVAPPCSHPRAASPPPDHMSVLLPYPLYLPVCRMLSCTAGRARPRTILYPQPNIPPELLLSPPVHASSAGEGGECHLRTGSSC